MTVRDAARDVAGIFGCGLTAYGAGQVYLPAGFIVAGAILIALAVLSARAA